MKQQLPAASGAAAATILLLQVLTIAKSGR
jgi:hypothetical protein